MSAAAEPDELHPDAEPTRLLALSDGIFGVAMTLAAVQVLPPDLSKRLSQEGTSAVLADLWPQFIGVAVTFLIVGFYWTTHHRLFNYIKRVNHAFISLNMLFLLGVTIMPFAVQVSSVPNADAAAVAFYGAYVGALGLLINLIWGTATRGHRLVDPRLPRRVIRYNHVRSLLSAAVFLASVPLAYGWDPRQARLVWLILLFNRRISCWIVDRL